MTIQIAVSEVDIDKIDIVEDFNSRKEFDPLELQRMADTIKEAGVVQSIKVRAKDDGRFDLVAGERRFRAAKLAGLTKVPVAPSTGNPRLEAFLENRQRADLNPIEQGLDFKALAEEFGLTTQKEIAEIGGDTPSFVGQHLRLLKLPEGVQRYIAEGTVPVDGEKCLREVAAVSPRIAECVCELAKRRKVKPSRFVSSFGDLLAELPENKFDDKPTLIAPRRVAINEVLTDPEKRQALVTRLQAVVADSTTEDFVLSFEDAEIDAARAAGCLVELSLDRGGYISYVRIITDAELAADLCERAVERIETEAAKRSKREAESQARQIGAKPDASPEDIAQVRKDKRSEAKKRQAEAQRFNEELGRKLVERRGGEDRKQHSLTRFRVLARLLIDANPELAARGLRLALPQLREVETKTLKSGEPREKVTYADAEQAMEYLYRRVELVGSVNEGLELLADALVAAVLADEEALPESKRTRYSATPDAWVSKALGAEIKAVRPRRRASKSS